MIRHRHLVRIQSPGPTNKGVSMHELEEKIMSCWNVTNDIELAYESVLEQDLTTDQIANLLIGLHQLYELRFNQLFSTYEKLLKK